MALPFNFKRIDVSAPVLLSTSPESSATGISVSSNIVLTFDETIFFGSSVFVLISKVDDQSTVEQFSASDINTKLTISNNVLTINPGSNLPAATEVALQFGALTIKDFSSNYYDGAPEFPGLLTFTTA